MSITHLRYQNINPYWILVLPFLAAVSVLYLGPILNILWLSFSEPKPIGLSNYQKLFESDSLIRIIITTLRICLITTLISVVFGYLIAFVVVHTLGTQQRWMLSLVLVSFWISILVRTFSWLMLLGNKGLVNNTLIALGLVADPIQFMRNETGVLIGMVQFMTPYAVLPLLANMQGLDSRVMNASRSLGASNMQTFTRIFFPLTKPGLIASALLVFIISLGFYVTPAILGGGKVLMVAEYISVQILITTRWGTAAMLAALMLFGVLGLLLLMNRFMNLSMLFGGSKG